MVVFANEPYVLMHSVYFRWYQYLLSGTSQFGLSCVLRDAFHQPTRSHRSAFFRIEIGLEKKPKARYAVWLKEWDGSVFRLKNARNAFAIFRVGSQSEPRMLYGWMLRLDKDLKFPCRFGKKKRRKKGTERQIMPLSRTNVSSNGISNLFGSHRASYFKSSKKVKKKE